MSNSRQSKRTMKLSVITSVSKLCKIIDVINDSIVKKPSAAMTNGTIEHGRIELEDLPALLGKLGNSQSLMHGVVKGSKLKQKNLVVTIVQDSENPAPGQISRSKEHVEFKGSHLSMLDHDPDVQCPHPYLSPLELLDVFGTFDSQWKNVANVVAMSSGAGLMQDGVKITNNEDGYHLYFQAHNAEYLKKYMVAVFKLSVIAGHGYIKLASNGIMLVRSCFDNAVFGPERIDFTAAPILKSERLTQVRALPKYNTGNEGIDCSQIPTVDEALYKKAVDSLKKDPAIVKKANSLKKKVVARLSRKNKISIKAATAIINGQLNGKLDKNDTILFRDHGSVTVADILKNLSKYDNAACADPSEPGEGTSKAMFFANDGERPLIHSMLHGGRNYYLFIGPFAQTVETVGLAMPTAPVRPNDFVSLMKAKLHELNPDFFCGIKICEGFQQLCSVYNE